MNGNTYRECSQHATLYITKLSSSSLQSLVDRRSNGVVAVRSTRVVETHPNRKVGVRVIDNHKINAITLITVGRVTLTITSDFIVIMNQHVCHDKNENIHSSTHI